MRTYGQRSKEAGLLGSNSPERKDVTSESYSPSYVVCLKLLACVIKMSKMNVYVSLPDKTL